MGLYWLQTLGCPKNQVDSDKLEGYLTAQGYGRAPDAEAADLVVVNTCAFIDAARQESIDTVLSLADRRRPGARLVVTGCMAERYGDELRDALPEVDLVAGFGAELTAPLTTPSATRAVPVALTAGRRPPAPLPATNGFDLLELPRPAARAPWAYVKVAEGCDRICGFCAIPSFRGKQRSRSPEEVLAEVDALARARRRRAAPARDRPRRPGPRLLRPGPLGPRSPDPHRPRPVAHCRPHPRRVGAGGAHPPPLPLSLRADRRADRNRARHGRALLRPLAPARGAPAARPHAPLGRRGALPAPHRRHQGGRPRGHVPLFVHPRLPRRDRA